MEPLLYNDDIIYFKRINAKQIKINDIVLINKQQLFIHRVIYKNNQYLVTKGDNNHLSDGKIKPNQVLGQVVKIKRGKNVYKPADIYLIQSGLYLKAVVEIKKLFEKNKIEYVFLKGLPLHLFFEGTHPKRLYFDCDILISRQCFPLAEKIILSQGYKVVDFPLSKQRISMRSKSPERSYQKIIEGFPINLDIHLEAVFMMTQLGNLEALYPQTLIDLFTYELLKTKREVNINKETFSILHVHYLIIYLSLHFFHHNFQGVFRLEFINKIVRRSKLRLDDWEDINKIIARFNLNNFIAPVFFLLKEYYQTSIPNFINHYHGKQIYKNDNIFDSEQRIVAGVNRFRNLFLLSPYPLWKKVFIFTNHEVIYYIFFVLKKKLFYFLKAVLKNR